jgi:hypothetical protein
MLLYQQVISNRISKLLAKYNIKEVHIPVKKNMHMLRPVKEKLGLKVTGIYCVLCKYGKAYVGQGLEGW